MEGVIYGNMGTDQWLAMPLKRTAFLSPATINCLRSLRQGWGPVSPSPLHDGMLEVLMKVVRYAMNSRAVPMACLVLGFLRTELWDGCCPHGKASLKVSDGPMLC